VVHAGDALKAATSTNVDGTFSIFVAPNTSYRVATELTAFATGEKTIALGDPPCDTTADFQLALLPRRPQSAPVAAVSPEGDRSGRPNAGRGARGGQGFQTLNVQTDANSEATTSLLPSAVHRMPARLLPAGFRCRRAVRKPSPFPEAATPRASTADC
jgi:hypothetical protein